MNDKERVFFPTIEETVHAFNVATDARYLVEEFATTGHFKSSTVMSLLKSLYDLEMNILGGAGYDDAIAMRCSDLQDRLAQHPEISAYFNYYIEYDSNQDRTGTIHRFERDPETEELVTKAEPQ